MANYLTLYNQLPADLKHAIGASDTGKAVETIHTKHKLHIDQLEPLENLTLDVLYGVVKPNDYVQEVAKVLGVDDSQAASIAVDMNALVFQPVRSSLLALHQGGSSNNTDVDRSSILREIQNPTPTPMSGRRYATTEEFGSKASNAAEESLLPDAGKDSDTFGSLASNSELEARLPDSAPTSIIDQKAAEVTTSPAAERTVDPYLEIPE